MTTTDARLGVVAIESKTRNGRIFEIFHCENGFFRRDIAVVAKLKKETDREGATARQHG